MIQYDSIRVYNPDLKTQFQKYLHRGVHDCAVYHFGQWKRDNGYFVGKGNNNWDDSEVLERFMNEVNPDIVWGDMPTNRFEICKDYVCESSPKEFLKYFNESIKSLPVRYTILKVNDSYICIKYKDQEWLIYHKKKREGFKYDNIIRFEYRMNNSAGIRESFGRIPKMKELCNKGTYNSLKTLFEEKWLSLIDMLQFEEKSAENRDLFQQALLYSKERDGFVDYKIVEKIIAGKAIRELYGKSWYQCFDPREPVGKRRLMCWRDNIEGTLKGFYEWRDEKGFDGIAGIKEKLVDMVLEK